MLLAFLVMMVCIGHTRCDGGAVSTYTEMYVRFMIFFPYTPHRS